jgi:hypothetical protein
LNDGLRDWQDDVEEMSRLFSLASYARLTIIGFKCDINVTFLFHIHIKGKLIINGDVPTVRVHLALAQSIHVHSHF